MKKNLFSRRRISVVIFVSILGLFAFPNKSIYEQNYSKANTVPINIGTNGCVCKGDVCQDQNWISFRKYCGYGDGTDYACSQVDNGQCN